MRSHTLVDRVRVRPVWEADDNVRVLEPETGIDVRRDFVIRLKDILDININEVVEGVNMLFD